MTPKFVLGRDVLNSDADVIAKLKSDLLWHDYDTVRLSGTFYADREFVAKLIADLEKQVFLMHLDPKGISPLTTLGIITLLESAYIKVKEVDDGTG